MEILMSRHALEQARERGITINGIKEAVQRGAKHIQDNKIISIYRHIKVVFKIEKENAFIITVMIRTEKNGK